MTLISTHLCKRNDLGSLLECVGVAWFPALVLLQTCWATLSLAFQKSRSKAILANQLKQMCYANTTVGNRGAWGYQTAWALSTFPSLFANLK